MKNEGVYFPEITEDYVTYHFKIDYFDRQTNFLIEIQDIIYLNVYQNENLLGIMNFNSFKDILIKVEKYLNKNSEYSELYDLIYKKNVQAIYINNFQSLSIKLNRFEIQNNLTINTENQSSTGKQISQIYQDFNSLLKEKFLEFKKNAYSDQIILIEQIIFNNELAGQNVQKTVLYDMISQDMCLEQYYNAECLDLYTNFLNLHQKLKKNEQNLKKIISPIQNVQDDKKKILINYGICNLSNFINYRNSFKQPLEESELFYILETLIKIMSILDQYGIALVNLSAEYISVHQTKKDVQQYGYQILINDLSYAHCRLSEKNEEINLQKYPSKKDPFFFDNRLLIGHTTFDKTKIIQSEIFILGMVIQQIIYQNLNDLSVFYDESKPQQQRIAQCIKMLNDHAISIQMKDLISNMCVKNSYSTFDELSQNFQDLYKQFKDQNQNIENKICLKDSERQIKTKINLNVTNLFKQQLHTWSQEDLNVLYKKFNEKNKIEFVNQKLVILQIQKGRIEQKIQNLEKEISENIDENADEKLSEMNSLKNDLQQNLQWTGQNLYYKEEYTQQQLICQQALGLKEELCGKDDIKLITIIQNIAISFVMQNQYEEAQYQYSRILKIQIDYFKDEYHENIFSTYLNIGIVFKKQNKLDKGQEMLFKAMKIQHKVLKAEGEVLQNEGDHQGNEDNKQSKEDQQAEQNQQDKQGGGQQETQEKQDYNTDDKLRVKLHKEKLSKIYYNISTIYKLQHNYIKAIKYLKLCFKEESEIYQDEYMYKGITLFQIGEIYMLMGNITEAINFHENALENISETTKHETIRTIFINLSVMHQKIKNYPKALDYSEQALKIAKIIVNQENNNMEIIGELTLIAQNYNFLQNKEKSLEIYKQIIETKKDHFKVEVNDDLKEDYVQIHQIYKDLGKEEEAANYQKYIQN